MAVIHELIDVDESSPLPKRIKRRLHQFQIKNLEDAFWIEEAHINGLKLDLLTVDLSSWFIRGFEVKISRGDFLADLKWQNYLPFVNKFFFATPPGLLKTSELPDEVGLLEFHEATSAITVVKKAKFLQRPFLRRNLGEEFVVRMMQGFIRDMNWRAARAWAHCSCGKQINLLDARSTAGTRISI